MNIIKSSFTIGGISFDTQMVVLIVLGTILPMLDAYRHSPVRWFFNLVGMNPDLSALEIKAYDRLVFYLLVPLIAIWFLWRENPAAFGFQWGNWREGLLWTVGACVGMSVILWFIARTPGMLEYYDARAPREAFRLIYITGVDLFGWEFIWRGFLLFGLARVLGVGPAIWIQAIPFAFMHLGKPEVETLTTIFGGAAFAFVAWRTQSFVYPFFIHWYIASFTQLIALGRF
ncbi:MAG: CPBP family intramembrane metalloprotease [Ardenticatenaceae bacterium]|nr:CPBP family intramembrane metalloprotease [Ardenticatenaceae bacterium]